MINGGIEVVSCKVWSSSSLCTSLLWNTAKSANKLFHVLTYWNIYLSKAEFAIQVLIYFFNHVLQAQVSLRSTEFLHHQLQLHQIDEVIFLWIIPAHTQATKLLKQKYNRKQDFFWNKCSWKHKEHPSHDWWYCCNVSCDQQRAVQINNWALTSRTIETSFTYLTNYSEFFSLFQFKDNLNK